ncbi:MAG: HEAT repeat domain-containing protein [Planctomycetota bacterium]
MPTPTLAERASARIQTSSSLERFWGALDRLVSPADAESFWLVEEAFGELVRSDFLRSLVTAELTAMNRDGRHIPHGGLTELDLAVFQGDKASLALRIVEPSTETPERLYSRCEHTLMCPLPLDGASDFRFESFLQPDPFPAELLDTSRRLVPRGVRSVPPGAIERIRLGYDLFRALPTEVPTVLLFLVSRTSSPIQWEYDLETLLPVRAISSSAAASRLQFTARMLSELGDASSLEALSPLLTHPAHYVRWSAVQAIARLDRGAGLRALAQLCDDDHPHVRNAAESALNRLRSTSATPA